MKRRWPRGFAKSLSCHIETESITYRVQKAADSSRLSLRRLGCLCIEKHCNFFEIPVLPRLMKTKIPSLLIIAFLPIAAISLASAQESTASGQPSAESNVISVVPQLEQAYSTLTYADHDYKGHRVKAMFHIQAAIRELGSSDSVKCHKVREAQTVSDAQLRSAQGILEQVQPQVTGKVLFHVTKAIGELTTALSIR